MFNLRTLWDMNTEAVHIGTEAQFYTKGDYMNLI